MARILFILALTLLLALALLRFARAALLDNEPAVTDLKQLLEPGRHRIDLNVDGHDRKVIFITP